MLEALQRQPAARFDVVPFAGSGILAARIGDEVRVPMKRFCETIGLPWAAQQQRIRRDDVLREGVSMMLIPSEGGPQEQLTLPLDLIPGFLFTAEARRYKPELQERVRLFRAECFRVLHQHFFGRATAPAPADLPGMAAASRETTRLVQMLKRETSPRIRRLHHHQLQQLCQAQGFDAPPLESIGADAIAPAELVGPFMRGLETLSTLGVVWNHSREPGKIAFDLAEVLQAFQERMIPMPGIAIMARALRDHGPVIDATVPMISNITGRHVLCWVFADGDSHE
ncbi:MAG: phage antirepressor N-terminal domain-containing protein [Pseudomonadota bacterium]